MSGHPYYLEKQEQLRKQHRALMRMGAACLAARYGQAEAEAVARESEEELARLIPELPYVGGRANPYTSLLVEMSSMLALYRALKRHGRPVEEAGELIRELTETRMKRYPRWLRRLLGRAYLSGLGKRRVQRAAERSQRREYPEDFVFQMVEGNGRDFAWGVDYLECGVVKLFRAQGATELTPYLCMLDFVLFPAMGVRLQRRETLAQGCARCDFRFGGTAPEDPPAAEGGPVPPGAASPPRR